MSRKALDQTLKFIETLDRAKSSHDISIALLSVVAPFGFERVLAGIIPTPGMSPDEQIANIILHHWPEDWSQRYFSQGYLFDDPTIKMVCSSTESFLWSEIETTYQNNAKAKRLMHEASEFHLANGLTVPMVTLEGRSVGLSLASERIEVPPESKSMIHLLAAYAFAKGLGVKNKLPNVPLTPRELDVLQWMAEGKSDWEIGKILHVSEHLVDKVSRNIKGKLGAHNRTQAVAYALRQKLIQ